MNVEQDNARQREVVMEMASKWQDGGVEMMWMKGQAVGTYYPEPSHRVTGDVDVYMLGEDGYEKGNRIAAEAGAAVDTHWYKHSQIHWKGEMFENHQYFVHTRDGKRGKRLDRTLRELLERQEMERFPGSGVLLPPVMFNALFLTYHGLAHFVSEASGSSRLWTGRCSFAASRAASTGRGSMPCATSSISAAGWMP